MMRVVLLLLLLLASAVAAYDDPEWAEWEPFVRRMRQYEQDGLAGVVYREPDTPFLKTCAGWAAQEMCSTVFGSEIAEAIAHREDLGWVGQNTSTYVVDYDERSVVAKCSYNNPLNQTYKSIFRDGIGCTLVERLTEQEIRAQDLGDQRPPTPLDPNTPWPEGEGFFDDQIPPEVDVECLQRYVDEDFADRIMNARAIVIVYKDRIVLEQYAPGITKDKRLLGWSATKSLTQAMIGIVVRDGLLNISDYADVPEWYETPGDERQQITYDMMLRMCSGTRWVGDLGPSTHCLFWSDADCAHICANKPLQHPPDTVWNYNSGSSYILSRIIMDKRLDRQWNNYEWPKRRLFYPIGAHSMYIEYQPNALFLGGGYGYGTARDWARFGLLYLHDGVWIDGTRILPEGWAQYSATPSLNTRYGAHFWRIPTLDPDMFYASGFRNQNVFIFPNHNVVIARLAMPALAAHPVFEQRKEEYLANLLSCIGPAKKP